MTIVARPYDYTRSLPTNIRILDALVANPQYLTTPQTPEDARFLWIAMLTNPEHIVYEVWRDEEIVGIMWLARITRGVDALLHFVFFDRDLVGKRKVLQNFLTFCFDELGFHRLSMEVPEGIRLERFARKVLRFRLEGEMRPRNPELPACLSDNWVARQGSRWDSAYYDGTEWKDIIRLRLLASEWAVDGKGRSECLGGPH